MAKVEQVIASLQKLYAKRSALDKQIVEVENKLITEAGTVSKADAPVKRAARAVKKAPAKKTAGTRKTVSAKKAAFK